jgi:chromosome segregation ATPase
VAVEERALSTFIQCHHREHVNPNVITGCRTPNLFSLYRQTQERLRELESQWEVSKGELEKLEQLQEALGAAAQYRTELEVRLQDSNSALAQAQKQKADVLQALEDKCASHEKLQQQFVDLGDQAAKREEGLSQECEDLRAQLVVAQTRVMEAAQYRTELEVRLQDSNSALAQAQKQKADVQQTLEDKCASHEKLQQQLVDLGDQAAKREEGLSQECEDLRAQLVVAQTQVMEADRMVNANNAEDEQSEAAIKALQDQLQDQQQLLAVAEVRSMSCFAPVLCVCRSFSKPFLAWNGKRSRMIRDRVIYLDGEVHRFPRAEAAR